MNKRNSIQKPNAPQEISPVLTRTDGRRKIAMRANRWMDAKGKEVLAIRNGENWWSVATATGPDFLLDLYGKQLAMDFFEWMGRQIEPLEGCLAHVLASMPADKGEVELAFIREVEHLASWMANATQSGGGE